jgi:AcrR family transcriptional regulator
MMTSMPASALSRPTGYFRKREKTRGKLLDAAKRVMAGKGVEGTTIAEIAVAADVAPGTFYNYFTTREEILEAVAASLVDEFRTVMAAIQRAIDDPAERIAVAVRLFLERVRDDALWGWFMARYGPSLPLLRDQTREIIRSQIIGEGLARKRFRLPSTRAVGDLITGTTVTALRSILEGRATIDIAPEIAELILRGLGVSLAEAHEIAHRPIPSLRRRGDDEPVRDAWGTSHVGPATRATSRSSTVPRVHRSGRRS